MKTRLLPAAAILFVIFIISCSPYRVPYLSLDLKGVYDQSDITVNYTYVCEDRDQRCVYRLYNSLQPSVLLEGADEVMPSTGSMTFTGLAEGDYILFFSVYSERDGESFLLKYLDESFEFTVDLP